nr:thioredoxin [Mucilaginibacter sp. L294]
MAVVITDDNFDELVLRSDKLVLLDFWADWCSPCKMVSPVVEELYKDYKDIAVIAKIDAERNPETSKKYGICNIPALLFFKNGEIVDRQIGAAPKSTLVEKLSKQLI